MKDKIDSYKPSNATQDVDDLQEKVYSFSQKYWRSERSNVEQYM